MDAPQSAVGWRSLIEPAVSELPSHVIITDATALASIAMSLKRIADRLDDIASGTATICTQEK